MVFTLKNHGCEYIFLGESMIIFYFEYFLFIVFINTTILDLSLEYLLYSNGLFCYLRVLDDYEYTLISS